MCVCHMDNTMAIVSPVKFHSYYSPNIDGFGIFGLQRLPLHKEVVSKVVKNFPRQRQTFHTTDALHIDQQDPLQPQHS